MDRGSAQIHIETTPAQVYAMVADVTRMGEWSPECYRCEWLDGADGPSAGARFRGYSKSNWLRWSRLVEVRVSPGRSSPALARQRAAGDARGRFGAARKAPIYIDRFHPGNISLIAGGTL